MSSSPNSMVVQGWGKYEFEGCGICEQSDEDIAIGWPSPISDAAHEDCFEKIAPLEAKIVKYINEYFEDKSVKKKAHIAAIYAVKETLGNVSIKTFLDNNGPDSLQRIFESVGLNAVVKCRYNLTIGKSLV